MKILNLRYLFKGKYHVPRPHPPVRLELHDLELELRRDLASGGFTDPQYFDPLGLEFRFEVFNQSGQKVVSGKIDHISGKQVTVRMIDTENKHRRQGYATASVLELSKHFGGLPIVPVGERNDGLHFWAALRERKETAGLVKTQISRADASALLRQEESIARMDQSTILHF